MNEKTESDFRNLLNELNSEKNRIKEVNNAISDKVNQFHAVVLPPNECDKQPSYPGLLGEFKTLLSEIVGQRQLMEITLKELITIVG
jgi:hypothetical protein